mmetsp:Transcript_81937/g.265461  ORF Transcript_81937/g.265461 Transcript_81937/m.265461 type:complete len:283 (-) Transcript_81937:2049-2897(-)
MACEKLRIGLDRRLMARSLSVEAAASMALCNTGVGGNGDSRRRFVEAAFCSLPTGAPSCNRQGSKRRSSCIDLHSSRTSAASMQALVPNWRARTQTASPRTGKTAVAGREKVTKAVASNVERTAVALSSGNARMSVCARCVQASAPAAVRLQRATKKPAAASCTEATAMTRPTSAKKTAQAMVMRRGKSQGVKHAAKSGKSQERRSKMGEANGKRPSTNLMARSTYRSSLLWRLIARRQATKAQSKSEGARKKTHLPCGATKHTRDAVVANVASAKSVGRAA